jgi:DNA-binding MarR family transcriptional regulator
MREAPSPRRALVFALLDLAGDINAVGQAASAQIGINQTDLICLNALFRQGPMSAGQLATAIGLTSGATTTAIDRLERAGYAQRRGDPTDRRKVLVHASEDGANQAFALFDGLLDAVADRAAAYTDQQLAQLHDLVNTFREIVANYAVELRARPPTTG